MKFWRNGLLAGRSGRNLQNGFAEQTHEYRKAIRMAFEAKVVKKIFIVRF